MNVIPLARRFVAVCVAALSVTTLPMVADARNLNGHAGLAMPKSDQYCLGYSYGTFINQCEHPVDVMYSPMMSNSPIESFTFTGRVFQNSSLACIIVSTDPGITTYHASPWLSLPNDGAVHNNAWTLDSLIGPKYIQCQLSQGAQLYHMIYGEYDNPLGP
jgi:hypothetical protein